MVLATLGFIQKGNKTLMIHFTKKGMSYDKWNGVGGKMDKRESPEDGLIREVYEETGLRIKNPRLRGFLSFLAIYEDKDWNVFVFTVKEFEGEPFKKTREGTLHWVENNKIKNLNLWADDIHWLHLLNQDRFFTGKFIFKDNLLVDAHVKIH